MTCQTVGSGEWRPPGQQLEWRAATGARRSTCANPSCPERGRAARAGGRGGLFTRAAERVRLSECLGSEAGAAPLLADCAIVGVFANDAPVFVCDLEALAVVSFGRHVEEGGGEESKNDDEHSASASSFEEERETATPENATFAVRRRDLRYTHSKTQGRGIRNVAPTKETADTFLKSPAGGVWPQMLANVRVVYASWGAAPQPISLGSKTGKHRPTGQSRSLWSRSS